MKVSPGTLSIVSVWFVLGCATSAQSSDHPQAGTQTLTSPTAAPSATSTTAAAAQTEAAPAAPSPPTPPLRIFVGSGDWGTATGAVTVFTYDEQSGNLVQASRANAGGLLSFLASDSQHRWLYAADEGQAKLRSFAINAEDGSVTPVATTDMVAGPVYVTVPKNEKFVLAAEFNSGKTEVFSLDAQGAFGKRSAIVDSGKESHGVFLSPDERFVLVTARGSDRVSTFQFDAEKGTLTPKAQTKLPKGAGCRHLDFHPNGRFAYLINEFANTIVAFTYDTTFGKLQELQTISTSPDDGVKSSAADIHVHPSGKFLYATNRPAGADGSIVVYTVAEDGKLTLVQKQSTEGQVPRNFDLVAEGSRILVGNQESKSIVSFAVDPVAGTLTKQALTTLDVKPFFVSDL